MSEVRDVLGMAGYGATWLLLERIAESWDGQGEPGLCLPEREWCQCCGFSKNKFGILEKLLQKHNIVRTEKSDTLIYVAAPILLQLHDEWTRKVRKNSVVTSEPLRSDYGIQTNKEAEINKDRKTHPAPLQLRQSLVTVLKRHGIEPDSERGRRIIRYTEHKQPKNPGGYVEKILQAKPNFDPESSESPTLPGGYAAECAVSVDDVLRRMGLGSG